MQPQPRTTDLDNQWLMIPIIDYEKRFHETNSPVVINKTSMIGSGDHVSTINSHVFGSTFDDKKTAQSFNMFNSLSVPSCDCGKLRHEMFTDMFCDDCNTIVRHPLMPYDGDIPHKIWVEFPDEIGGVMNPQVWEILSAWLTSNVSCKYGKASLLDIIINPNLPVPSQYVNIITGRGWRWLYDNFDRVMDQFARTVKKNGVKKSLEIGESYLNFIKLYRNVIFTKRLPILSSILHSVTTADGNETSGKLYSDKGSQYALTVIHNLAALEFKVRRRKQHDLAIWNIFHEYLQYTADIKDNKISDKYSLNRQHLGCGRFHWSGRGVIVPITGKHEVDEIHIPWQMAVNMYRQDILNILINRMGYTWPNAEKLHQNALIRYEKVIHEIFLILIKESPFKGLPVKVNRNPSIRVGATQLMFIVFIKIDIRDKAVGFPDMAAKPPNADFDGDEVNIHRLLENEAVEAFWGLHASERNMGINKLGISDMHTISPQQQLIAFNFLTDEGMVA